MLDASSAQMIAVTQHQLAAHQHPFAAVQHHRLTFASLGASKILATRAASTKSQLAFPHAVLASFLVWTAAGRVFSAAKS